MQPPKGERETRPDDLMQIAQLLKIGVLTAGARGVFLQGDLDELVEALKPTFQEIRKIAAEAQDRLDEALATIERQRAEHEQAITRMLDAQQRTRERAHDRIAKGIVGIHTASLNDDFDPRGFFVYLLWGDDDDQCPLYVGQSTNVLARLGSHLGDWRKKDLVARVTLFRCDSAEKMGSVEADLIRYYQPPLNKAGIIIREDGPG